MPQSKNSSRSNSKNNSPKKGNSPVTSPKGSQIGHQKPHAGSAGTQVHSKSRGPPARGAAKPPCPWPCITMPVNVPDATKAQAIIHPRKDVFVLKVAKVGANGDRRSKVEVELVTPKPCPIKIPYRVDTRETQCDPEPCNCCCPTSRSRKNKK